MAQQRTGKERAMTMQQRIVWHLASALYEALQAWSEAELGKERGPEAATIRRDTKRHMRALMDFVTPKESVR